MNTRGSRSRQGYRPARRESLELWRPLFVEPSAGQTERLLEALRTLFRDELEERLASHADSSVHPGTVDGEPAQ
jgi:hypothetical protein